jgi:monoamine oxidase
MADRVVLAMAPSDLDAIRLPDGVERPRWMSDVVSVPLFKGFLTYQDPWWDSRGFHDTCLITADAAQKVYFDSASRTVFFYADSRNARMWQRADAGGRTRMESEITQRVARASGLPLSSLAKFTDSSCTAWATGISYLGTTQPDPALGRLAPGIGLVTDAVTSFPGWLEGSVVAANRAWDLLALRAEFV